MSEVAEHVVNVKLAEILSRELGIDARSERIRNEKRPDIRCFYKGLIVCIKASYSGEDAERDALKRIEQGLADIALALRIKKHFKDMPELELYEDIKSSKFDLKILVPVETAETLIPFIERRTGRRAEPETGWFKDVDITSIKLIIENSTELLLKEEKVLDLLIEMKKKINNFINSLKEVDVKASIRKQIYDVFYKLYGLTIAEAEDPEVAFGHAALSILLSSTFYEHIRSRHPGLRSLIRYVEEYGAVEGLRRALGDLLKVGYKTSVEVTLNVLDAIPPALINQRVENLVNLGSKLASSKSLLRRDLAGRIYHEITGDIALRKGFATFYTEVPAAYLLAALAVHSLLNLDRESLPLQSKESARKLIDKIRTVKVGDMACGSGTLLTASYSTLMRVANALKCYHGLDDVNLDELGKTLVEEGIYGIDALRYASQVTAINLALVSPSAVSKENVFTIYLGYLPERDQAWLGSLELINNSGKVGGLLAYIEGGLKGFVERVSVEGVEGKFSLPRVFDIVIMNPPFTRATGRTEKFGGERGFFGFIASREVREKLISAYSKIRDRVRKELKIVASSSENIFPYSIQEIIRGKEDLDQYLNIAPAGEGLLFLYLAHKYVNNGGVIAFVLPRSFLAGISWFLARVLLASRYHVKHIVVSSDPDGGYNFSEGTKLSETLVVAKRMGNYIDREETLFINLLRKPSTALEAVILAEELKEASRTLSPGESTLVNIGSSRALVFKVDKKQLLENVDNWNKFVALPDPDLFKIMICSMLRSGEIVIGDQRIAIPLTNFDTLIDIIGVDSPQFHDHFKASKTRTAYPIVYGGGEGIRTRMMVSPNYYASPKSGEADRIFKRYAGRILVPDRIWWDTVHAVVLYSKEPVLSNIFYSIKPRVKDEDRSVAEKALVLWLNTVWGVLMILLNRQETRGRWTRLKKAQWRILPVLDISKLRQNELNKLAEIFDKYATKELRRVPKQFDPVDPDPVRFGMDIEFLRVFNPSLSYDEVEKSLLGVYKRIHIALGMWMGDNEDVS